MTVLFNYKAENPNHSFRILKAKGLPQQTPCLTCHIDNGTAIIAGRWEAFCGNTAEYYYEIEMFHGLAKESESGKSISWHKWCSGVEAINITLAEDCDASFATMWIQSLLTGLSGQHEL